MQLPLYATLMSSAAAACWAETLSLPVDTAKVRLQLQGSTSGGKYNGLMGTMRTIIREEGAAALWKGLTPGLHRQCLFGGLRIGMYEPVKNAYVGADHTGPVPLHLKIAAALTTGAIAISIASPTDLVKVRLQSEGKLPPGATRRYPSAMQAYGIIAKQEGVRALWTGIGPNVVRNSVMNAAELASYDQIKESLLATGLFVDDVRCHIMSGLGAGFVATCIGSPVDVVKSRVMGDSAGVYKGTIDCFVKTFTNEGIFAFYRGFIPNFTRLGSWNVIMFLTLEQIKAAIKPQFERQ